MKSYNVTSARAELYKLVNLVNEDHAPVQITGKNGDAVLISAEDWSAIEETLYLNGIPGMADSIERAAREPRDEMTPMEEIEW